jgi:hypothetical protein
MSLNGPNTSLLCHGVDLVELRQRHALRDGQAGRARGVRRAVELRLRCAAPRNSSAPAPAPRSARARRRACGGGGGGGGGRRRRHRRRRRRRCTRRGRRTLACGRACARSPCAAARPATARPPSAPARGSQPLEQARSNGASNRPGALELRVRRGEGGATPTRHSLSLIISPSTRLPWSGAPRGPSRGRSPPWRRRCRPTPSRAAGRCAASPTRPRRRGPAGGRRGSDTIYDGITRREEMMTASHGERR